MGIAILVMFASACTAPDTADEIAPELNESDDLDFSLIRIGFSLSGTGAFYDQLQSDIKEICERLNYDANIVIADSGAKQQSDVMSMASSGAAVIIIDPVDVDIFESILADLEMSGIPVINIIDQINGKVSTLISPDYQEIGRKAAQQAAAIFANEEGRCLELKSDYDSFVMQLISDGFGSIVNETEGVTLTADAFCGLDEQKAYEETKNHIQFSDVNFVFAHNAALARGALRAIEEISKPVHLVVYGGDMDLIGLVQSGKINTAIFFGTKELADIAVGVADEFIKSTTYQPSPYIKLTADMVTAENAAEYISDQLLFAQVKDQVS